MTIGSISGAGTSDYAGYGLNKYNSYAVGSGQEGPKAVQNPGESEIKQAGRKSSPAECETCKNRKYQDGSDEMVSFKSPAHVSPNAAGAAVRAHEQEHVSNAYKKAAEKNGKVIQASVSIQSAICPECGRTYVAGGETRTQIKYFNEENPYQKAKKLQDSTNFGGMNMDLNV